MIAVYIYLQRVVNVLEMNIVEMNVLEMNVLEKNVNREECKWRRM